MSIYFNADIIAFTYPKSFYNSGFEQRARL